MARKKPKTILYRRKRDGLTNYRKRLRLLLAQVPRLVVRFTNKQLIAQVIDFSPEGDKVIAAVNSLFLKKLGWNYSCKNVPAAYLTGLLLGKKVVEKGAKKVILDTGFRRALGKGRIYAFLKGFLDSGAEVPVGDEEKIFPSAEHIQGKHIEKYAVSLKGKSEKYEQQFGQYLKSKALPEEVSAAFVQLKQKIMESNRGSIK